MENSNENNNLNEEPMNLNHDNKKNENKKKSKKAIVLLIILVIAIIGLAVEYLCFKDVFVKSNSDEKQSNSEKQEIKDNEDKSNSNEKENDVAIKEQLDINSALVQNIYNKVKWQGATSLGDSFEYLFKNKNITVDKIPEDIALRAALATLNKDAGNSQLSKEQVAHKIKEFFGDYKYTDKSVDFGGFKYNYDATTGIYTFEGGFGGFFSAYDEEIIEAVKVDSDVEITTKAVFKEPYNDGDWYFEYYSSPDHTDSTILYRSDANGDNFVLSNYYDQLNTYKYTFKLGSDGNYYFYKFETLK